MGGPWRMFKPELPNLATGAGFVQSGVVAGQPGIANAEGSKKWLTVQCSRFPLPMRSGSPPIVPVPDGSKPENEGAKYWPSCATAVQLVRHPPRIYCTGAGALERKRSPRPTGNAYTAYAKKRCGTTVALLAFSIARLLGF